MAEVEGARARQYLFADYEEGLQQNEFADWFRQAPRPGFSKATVSAWRASLEASGLGPSSIIIRMSAIRKLAGEAVDNGPLAPKLAASIRRVRSVKSEEPQRPVKTCAPVKQKPLGCPGAKLNGLRVNLVVQ